MSQHSASIRWDRRSFPFKQDGYSRVHEWSFDGGLRVRASASPSIVPIPLSDPSAVDPEEAFLASLSSCHMLWFLSLAVKEEIIVDSCEDSPEGFLLPLGDGRLVLGRIRLTPQVTLQSPASAEQLDRLHRDAHHQCFLANALRVDMEVCPRPPELSPPVRSVARENRSGGSRG